MKLDYKKTVYIGMAFLGISAFWQLYDVIMPLILENTFQLDKTLTGVIMSLDNILAVFLLPIFGTLSDKHHGRYGKRTPFIFWGTLLACLGLIVIPVATNQKQFILFNVALAVSLIAMSVYRAPAIALMPDLTPKPLRSKANAIINLMGASGAILALMAIRLFVSKTASPDYTIVFIVVAFIMLLSFVILRLTIDENKMQIDSVLSTLEKQIVTMPKPVKKSLYFLLVSIFLWFMAYNGITTAFSRYAIVVWEMSEGQVATALMVSTIVAISTYIPSGLIATKIGRKFAILIGIICVSITYFLGSIFTTASIFIYIMFSIMGIGWAFINVNALPMLVELSKAGDVGKYTGMYYTSSMCAQILTPILSGFLMQHMGFHILFPYALVFSMLSFLTMVMVNHGDTTLAVDSKLELFNDDIEV